MDLSKASDIIKACKYGKNPEGFKLQGTIDIHGLHIKVENRKGSVRKGKDPDGNEWSIKMKFPYGYISRTKAADGEHVDCYVGDDRKSNKIFVIHQNNPWNGKYDEDKVMIGFKSASDAKKAYLEHYDSPKFFGSMTEMDVDTFKKSLKKNKGKKLEKAIRAIKKGYLTETQLSTLIVGEYVHMKDTLSKGGKMGLVQKKVWVTKNGKTYQTTVWVREGDESAAPNQSKNVPVGESIGAVRGMDVVRYSDKAVLIKGDTYANKDTMREIKKDLGVGNYNGKLKGWIFPSKYLDKILGVLFSSAKAAGDDEKAEAIQNQKNELPEGTKVSVSGISGEITEGASTSDGTKYNIKTDDGVELNNVDERVVGTKPETDPKEIRKAINEASPESRVKVEKKLYGLKPVTNIHTYTLQEYMGMHGLSQSDIDSAVARMNASNNDKDGKKKNTSSGGGGNPKKSDPSKKEGLTKQQLISKLIYNHYQAVKKAMDSGEKVPSNVLSSYPDLKKQSAIKKVKESKKREAMSEETKKKISEALKKNGKEEDDQKDQSAVVSTTVNKENYKPKDGEDIEIKGKSNIYGDSDVTIKTKDYRDVPSKDITVPKPNKILTEPKPYWLPKIDMDKFARKGHTLDAIKLGEDKFMVALDGFTSGMSYTLSNRNVNTEGRYAVMSLDMYAATVQYYLLYAKEDHKKKENEAIAERKAELEARGFDTSKTRFKKSRIKVLTDNKMTQSQGFLIRSMTPEDDPVREKRNWQWEVYRQLNADRKQKQIDMDLYAEYVKSAYTKGAETSYGDSGTKDNLLKDYGVKVKRQNGDEINDAEIAQIKSAMDSTAKVFGNNVEMNKNYGLKVSHSGNVLMHARKAVGLFTPIYNAIGVSAKDGDDEFKFTWGHEYAHFLDNQVGNSTGHNFASDKQGSTANRIASEFRRSMNKVQSSDYQNRTCECFARALEQYHAVEAMGKDNYFTMDNHVSKENYQLKIKPLIEQFLQENKALLKGNMNDLIILEASKLK